MMIIDWSNLLLGLTVGVGMSVLYFAGLAASISLALTASWPAAVLLPSAALRIGLLLAVGWMVTDGATLVWALAGYGLGFFLVRTLATMAVRRPRPEDV